MCTEVNTIDHNYEHTLTLASVHHQNTFRVVSGAYEHLYYIL